MFWAGLLVIAFLFQAAKADLDSVNTLLRRGDYQNALRALEASSPSDKQTGEWHLLASKAYDGLNQPKEAVAEAEAALAINPSDQAYHLQLGQIFLSRNTPKAAFEVFDEALKLFPDSLLLLLGRGVALMNLGSYDRAEKDLMTCLDRKPDLGIAFESLETVYFQTSRPEEAEKQAESYERKNPTDFRGFYFWAAAEDRLNKDNSHSEVEALNMALNLKPDYTPAKVLLAKVFYRTGDSTKALSILEQAVRDRADYAPAHLELATLYRKLGRREDAERESQILQRLSDNRPAALKYHRSSDTSDQK
ncbi:MAG: tetratricopeptide repeat protein [Bryobacteraceae bacterium]